MVLAGNCETEHEQQFPDSSHSFSSWERDRVFAQALDTLDLSGLPPGFRRVLAVEQVIRLSEILARLDISNFVTYGLLKND